MKSVQLLLRQSLRTSVAVATKRSWQPYKAHRLSLLAARKEQARSFTICLRCQFRARPSLFLSNERDKIKDGQSTHRTRTNTQKNQPQSRDTSSISAETTDVQENQEHFSSGQGREESKLQHARGHLEEAVKDGAEGENSAREHERRLPSNLEDRRSQLSKQFTALMDTLQSNVFVAGQRLNDLTGYSAIESLKRDIERQEARVRETRALVRDAKEAFATAINRRSASQREVNELLQRKHAWSSADLERFTHLYRNDHANEVAETEAQEALSSAERQAEEAAASLSKSILSRYHEEQVWSDKIRRMSTWGTWGLMGVNVLLFLVFQVVVEPWRRRRLVKGFEEKVIEALEKEKALNHAQTELPQTVLTPSALADGQDMLVDFAQSEPGPVADAVVSQELSDTASYAPSPKDLMSSSDAASSVPPTATSGGHLSPETHKPPLARLSLTSWQLACRDLFSDRQISVSQQELTTMAIQSAAAGAAVTGLLIALIRPR